MYAAEFGKDSSMNNNFFFQKPDIGKTIYTTMRPTVKVDHDWDNTTSRLFFQYTKCSQN